MEWSLLTVYLGCAAAGGTILLVQTVMLLFGGGDHDGDMAHVDTGIGASDSGEVHTQDTGFGLLQLSFERAQFAIAQLCRLLQIIGALGPFDLNAHLVDLLLLLAQFGNRISFRLPACS